MKIKIKKEKLLEVLNKVSKAISTKNLIPVLAGIKIEVDKDKMTLTASDNDITIQSIIYADEDFIISETGAIIVTGKYMLDIVRKLPTEYIDIEVDEDSKISIFTENSNFDLNGISVKEYPNINLEESKSKIKINVNTFKEMVNQTAFASSHEENKPILTGINFNIAGDILECNSTDSYRLARKIIKLSSPSKENYNIVVPSRNLLELVKIVGSKDEDIEINIFSNKILFKLDNLLFQSRLINGTYPNTSNLIPKDDLVTISTNLYDFYNMIDRVSILTSDKEKNIVTLETVDNTVILKSDSLEIGKVEEKMEVNKSNNENIKISFSARYMMEALKSFSTEDVDIHFIGEVKPIIIKSKTDDSLIQLVLPIRTY